MKRFFLYLIVALIACSLLAKLLYPRQCALITMAHAEKLIHLQHLVSSQDWEKLETTLKDNIRSKCINETSIRRLASITPNSPFDLALQATDNILSLPEKTGLNFVTTFPIALFAETSLANEIEQNHYYWKKERFGRELQVDPKTNAFFIHLGTNGVKKIGKGKFKVVTKTILYSRYEPEIMARGVARSKMRKECAAMKAVRGLPGVLQAQAILEHRDPSTQKRLRTIITRIYNSGSLKSVLDSQLTFDCREKLQLALDLITGLTSLHSKRIAHRDLSARNYFVHIEHSAPSSRSIRAVVADLGRALHISRARNVSAQGNSSYLAPEAFFRKKMKGEDYLSSDIFALGCVLWEIYFGYPPSWRKEKVYNKYIIDPKKGFNHISANINELRNNARESLKNMSITNKKYMDRFLSLILQMTDPISSNRGTTASLRDTMRTIVEEYDRSLSPKTTT